MVSFVSSETVIAGSGKVPNCRTGWSTHGNSLSEGARVPFVTEMETYGTSGTYGIGGIAREERVNHGALSLGLGGLIDGPGKRSVVC